MAKFWTWLTRTERYHLLIKALLLMSLVLLIVLFVRWKLHPVVGRVDAFWTPLWASLISGTVYSLFTGIIVGYLVGERERHDTKHREDDQATRSALLNRLCREIVQQRGEVAFLRERVAAGEQAQAELRALLQTEQNQVAALIATLAVPASTTLKASVILEAASETVTPRRPTWRFWGRG